MDGKRAPIWAKPKKNVLDTVLSILVRVFLIVAAASFLFATWAILRVFPSNSFDLTALVGAACIASLAIIIWLPKLQLLKVNFDSSTARFAAENEARKTVAALVGGLAIFLSFYSAQQTLALQQQGQFTDRYTKAIEQLAASDTTHAPQISVRLGGLYALEQIMNSSQGLHFSILEVLCAYIRENSVQATLKPRIGPRADVRVALTVLGRRNRDTEREEDRKTTWGMLKAFVTDREFLNVLTVYHVRPRLDLSTSDLTSANLDHLVLPNVDLSEAHLSGCSALFADLRGANFDHADLSRCIIGSDLEQVHFEGANLEGGVIVGKIVGATFTGANVSLSSWFGAEFEHPQDIQAAVGWKNAFYADRDLAALGLPADHNATLERWVKSRNPTFSIATVIQLSSLLKTVQHLSDAAQAARDGLLKATPSARP